jgi:hypothetical protein
VLEERRALLLAVMPRGDGRTHRTNLESARIAPGAVALGADEAASAAGVAAAAGPGSSLVALADEARVGIAARKGRTPLASWADAAAARTARERER